MRERSKLDAQRNCLLRHPTECYVRQACFRIAAPEIVVDAGEPKLLYRLARSGRRCPQRQRELSPTFIYRERLICVEYVGM